MRDDHPGVPLVAVVKPYEGSHRPTSVGYHRARAPWPTCSCQVCREARRRNDRSGGDDFREALRRLRTRRLRTSIYRDLRREDSGR